MFAAVSVAAAAGCAASHPRVSPTTTARASTTGSSATGTVTTAGRGSTTTTGPAAGCPQRVLAGLSEAQRVGQLFMIGEPLASPDDASQHAVKDLAVGGVVLYGGSDVGLTAIGALTARLRAAAKGAVPAVGLYISTDQEGGQIQQLTGPGFDPIPPALVQGTIDPTRLRADAGKWGSQLSQAGVNVDLAPVVDVVPPSFLATNQPIAHYQRELGSSPDSVATHGVAVVQGLQGAGVGATLKHFPGLGRVVGNTDNTASVVDTTTTRHDSFLSPFAAGIKAGASFVLVSLATYSRVDPANRAVFSSLIMRDILRGDLGFRGLVISDDLGAAVQVGDVAPGARAVDFLAAGGTIVLAVKPPSVFAPMVAAVEAQAAASPAFRQLVDSDVLAVLTAKAAAGLVTCP